MGLSGAVLLTLLFVGHPGAREVPGVLRDSADHPLIYESVQRTVRYEVDGTGTITLAARVLVRNEAGVRLLGELTFPYDSASQRLNIDTVRVLKSGGGVVVAPASAVQDVTAPVGREAPMYSDLREKIITVPGLRPGDTLEYYITWVEQTPITPGEFWYSAPFIRTAIVRDERLIIDVPRQKYVLVKTQGGPSPQISETTDRRIYRWRLANLAVDTTATAAKLARAHGVQLTTFHSWADVGRWYLGLEHDREAVTPAVQAKAAELVRGRTSLRDSLTAVYEFVAQNFRYVSLSFGVGRYQPHQADEVLVNDYGDCKDKHVLLAALLHAIGVPSAPALISSTGRVDSSVPSPLQFDHVITVVPSGRDTIWLDATPGLAPFGLLLYPLRGQTALVMMQPTPPQLARTPAAPPFPMFEHAIVSGAISPSGTVTLAMRYSMRGDEEAVMREVVQELPHDRLTAFANGMLQEFHFSGTASNVETSSPTVMSDPFSFGFRIDQPVALTWRDRRASYQLPLPPLDLPSTYDSTNATDTLSLEETFEATRQLNLVLPAGTSAELPVPVKLRRDYGDYASTYVLHGDTLVVQRTVHFTRSRVTPNQTADWNSFRRTVKDDEDQGVTLVRSINAPAAPAAPVTGADAEQLHAAGLDALNAGDAATAVRLFREVVKLEPRHQFAWNNLGRAYMQQNQLDSAVAAFQKQADINPYDQYAYNNIGLVQWRRGDLLGAAVSFGKEIEVHPLDRYAHANLGRVDLLLERDSDAVHELSQAVVISPEDGPVRADLGRAWLRLNQTDSAVVEFDRAVELAPNALTWNTVAYALAQSGQRLDRAAVYARSAVDATTATLRTLTPEHIGPRELASVAQLGSFWDTLGWIEFRRGNTAAAEPYVRAAWLLLHHTEVGDHLGQIYEAQGKKAAALQTYAMAVNGLVSIGIADARRHLAALVGSPGAAERWADSGKAMLMKQRTVHFAKGADFDGVVQVQLIVNSRRGIEQVRFLGAPQQFSALETKLKVVDLPIIFPDSTPTKLPLLGLVTCSTFTSDCSLVLEGGVNQVMSSEIRRR